MATNWPALMRARACCHQDAARTGDALPRAMRASKLAVRANRCQLQPPPISYRCLWLCLSGASSRWLSPSPSPIPSSARTRHEHVHGRDLQCRASSCGDTTTTTF